MTYEGALVYDGCDMNPLHFDAAYFILHIIYTFIFK
jgi:hypothetical protein